MALRILLADDQIATRHIVRFNLENFGFEVLDATNGQHAWEILQKEQVHLLVTDEAMPNLSGSELCIKIRQTPWMANLPIIMITGVVPSPSRESVKTLALSHLFTKPFSPRELVDKICETLSAQTVGCGQT